MSRPVAQRFPGKTILSRVMVSCLLGILLFVGTSLAWLLPQASDFLMAGKREKLAEQTNIAWTILERQETLVRQGKITKQAAQAEAAAVVSQLRYGPEMSDYFWINDIRPVMIMHPYRPDLVGRDLTTFRDAGGKALFLEMVKKVAEEGEGFVEYRWQRADDPETVAAKLSHVRIFRPWGWIIGTGVYLDDVVAEVIATQKAIIAVYLGLTLVGICLAWLLGSYLARTLRPAVTPDKGDARTGLEIREGGEIRLQTAILAVIIPALVTMTAASCLLVYRQLYGIIQTGFDRKLYAISSVVGSFIDGADHTALARFGGDDTAKAIAAEKSSLYQRYIGPMRQVMAKCGITYLYTQTLEERPYCCYVLDATTGKEHTPIGSRDKLPIADYWGAERVLRHGMVYVGGVEATELWGLIKSAFAPIYDPDGTIVAMAGADVNLSVIKAKTRVALFAVGVTGLVAMFIAGLLALILARRLSLPLAALKDGMLKVAAGQFEHRIPEQGPWELRRLAAASNRIGDALAKRLALMRDTYQEMMTHAQHRDLIMTLDAMPPMAEWPRVTVYRLAGETLEKSASGWAHGGDRAVIWLAAPVSNPVASLRLREDVSQITTRLLDQGPLAAADLLAALAPLVGREIHSLFLLSRNLQRLHYLTRQPMAIGRQGAAGWQRLTVDGAGELDLAGEKERLVITDQVALLGDTLYAWLRDGATTDRSPVGARQTLVACLQGVGVADDVAPPGRGGERP